MSNNMLPWIEKYRPKSLSEIISQEEIVKSISKFIENKSLSNVLFYGPSGCGKTSMIMACAYELYGDDTKFMVILLNASNERGIDTVRTLIKNFINSDSLSFVSSKKLKGKEKLHKLIILDEIDSMTFEAQGLLKQLIEINSEIVRFCLICNNINKIHDAIKSRCTLFQFRPLLKEHMKQKINQLKNEMAINIDDNAINKLIEISNGDMRIALNTLQQAYILNEHITDEKICKLLNCCSDNSIKIIFEMLYKVYKNKENTDIVIDKIVKIIEDNNILIPGIIKDLLNIVCEESYFTLEQQLFLIKEFSNQNNYCSQTINMKLIITSLVSAFHYASKK